MSDCKINYVNNFHEDMKKVFEPVTKSAENTSQDITKTIIESSTNNNKTLENLNNKLVEIMSDRCIIASYLLSPLSEITNPENSTQFKLVEDSSSITVNDLKRHNSVPVTLNDNLLSFRDTCKIFELNGDLLKTMFNENYNVDLASLSEKN